MSRNNNKLQLPLLTNSLGGIDINSNRVYKSINKEQRNIHLGITNFNSKLNELRKNKVIENKLKKFNPSVFEYQTLNKNLSIFTSDTFKPGKSLSNIRTSYLPERNEVSSPLFRFKNDTQKKNNDSIFPILKISHNRIYINNQSTTTKEDQNKQNNKQSQMLENSQEKVEQDIRIQDEDKINASNEILQNSSSSQNQVMTGDKKETSVNRKNVKAHKGNRNVPFQNSCLYNILGIQTRSILETKNKFNEENLLAKKELKNNLIRNNNLTHFLDAKEKNEIPYVFPVASTYDMNFENLSQLNRFEKMKQSLLNLKYIIEQDEENEIKIIKEFFIKNNLLNEKLFTLDYITKFSRFLKLEFRLDPKTTLKDLIEIVDKEWFERPIKKKKNAVNNVKGNYSTDIQENLEEKNYFEKFKTNDYLKTLDNIEKKVKIDKHNSSNLIKDLESELNKSIYNLSKKKHASENMDSLIQLKDIEKVKKNNKLLELIVLQRSKTNYLVQCTKEN